ncbi:hypothetical protein BDV28DRAFT_158822 [Aspergillus coremiiformis]|uniref:Uncharacterized protein n=1 Tax=Aspergillus coremiiformis TaxID=138285 RepID=A0A5N6Z2L4_9EURO|nr:hypothetical protein BDV28DRAFT_158822 [Aspergillus coremiiformis]
MRLSVFGSSTDRDRKRIRLSCIYPRIMYLLSSVLHSAEEDAIIAVTQGFLAALNAKSPADFEKYCIRAGGMSLWPPPPMLPRFCTLGVFVEQIAKVPDEIDERIWDPEVKVYESGNLAAVWAPFRSKINGAVNHVGVELFVLHKLNGQWKVTGEEKVNSWS